MKAIAVCVLGCALLASCREEPVRWSNERRIPEGAAPALVRELPFEERGPGLAIAKDYLHFMLESFWVGRDEGNRVLLQGYFETAVEELRGVPRQHRGLRLRQMAYREGLSFLSSLSENLAYSRIVLEFPKLVAKAPADSEDAQMFASAPKLTRDALDLRADELDRELRRLVEAYQPFVTPHFACIEPVEQREAEVRTYIANMSGDFAKTTGMLFRFLRNQGHATSAATSLDLRPDGWKHACPDPP